MATTNSDTALLTEHFGYPPVSLLDDIINSVNILAERALNSVEQGLLSQPPASLGFKPQPQQNSKSRSRNSKDDPTQNLSPEDAARHEIENGTHQLETLLCASIDRNLDKFELWVMQNVLCIRRNEDRDWIRLSHYDGLDFDAVARARGEGGDKDATSPSVDGIRHLRRRLQASQRLNVMLHAERARNEKLLGELRSLVGGAAPAPAPANDDADASAPPLAFLHDKGALAEGGAETPLTTTTAFTLSQLQALRALSTSLRTVLPDLSGAEEEEEETSRTQGAEEEEGDNKNKSWRRQRLEYVETATRRHLENVRGLELGRSGEVIDGEWQGEGRDLGKGEVEGLEQVVAILGPGPGSSGKADEMDES